MSRYTEKAMKGQLLFLIMLARAVKILLDTASILHYNFGANSALKVMTPQRATRCIGTKPVPFSSYADATLERVGLRPVSRILAEEPH
jgi:hypothetical protein